MSVGSTNPRNTVVDDRTKAGPMPRDRNSVNKEPQLLVAALVASCVKTAYT